MANDNDIIINELLCWVGNMISVLTLTQIVQYCEQKFPESVIKVAHEILHKRVITEDDKPNFVKRVSNKTGGTKSTIYWLMVKTGPTELTSLWVATF